MFSTLTIDESRDSTSKATRTGTVLPTPPATDPCINRLCQRLPLY